MLINLFQNNVSFVWFNYFFHNSFLWHGTVLILNGSIFCLRWKYQCFFFLNKNPEVHWLSHCCFCDSQSLKWCVIETFAKYLNKCSFSFSQLWIKGQNLKKNHVSTKNDSTVAFCTWIWSQGFWSFYVHSACSTWVLFSADYSLLPQSRDIDMRQSVISKLNGCLSMPQTANLPKMQPYLHVNTPGWGFSPPTALSVLKRDAYFHYMIWNPWIPSEQQHRENRKYICCLYT